MKASIAAKLAQLTLRLEELNGLLSSETRHGDIWTTIASSRASMRRLRPWSSCIRRTGIAEDDLHTAQELTQRSVDAGIRRRRNPGRTRKLTELEAELQKELLPKDPNDERNIFLEIRAGTGGDESALFAGDLFRMYARYAERNRWQVEVMSQSQGRSWAATRKSSHASSARERTRSSSSNPAGIACSACRPPKPKAAFTRPPARSRCCPKLTKLRTSC